MGGVVLEKCSVRPSAEQSEPLDMLSVLKRQAEQLEKELKEERLQHSRIKREHMQCETLIRGKEERIEELEAALASASETSSVAGAAENAELEEDPLSASQKKELQKKVDELAAMLRENDMKLSMESLGRSMAELKLATGDANYIKRINYLSKSLESAREENARLVASGMSGAGSSRE